MFDPESSRLLQSAPSLPGINAQDLPRLLTEIYTELVTERVRGGADERSAASVVRLTEIANSYESIAVTNNEPVYAAASAFVAGSAYQILAKSVPGDADSDDNVLNRDHISGDLAAALLFLIAEQLPDAREAILRFTGINQSEPAIIQQLALSLIDLVKENFGEIIRRSGERREASFAAAEENVKAQQAVNHLYELILKGVESLASRIIGKDSRETAVRQGNTAISQFEQALQLSTRQFTIPGLDGNYISTYPGPAHLAALLIRLAQQMLDATILNLPVPGGVDANTWQNWLAFRALQKPLLWPNHRTAIAKGFHLPGNSAVLVLPTGAGKTTIAEFKIAATLAAGKQVIFLAPTNALVEQLRNDLAESLPENIFGMEAGYDADLLTAVKGILPDLSVMTPEKCLAVLNFNPEAFEGVGLVIFDECHSLSAEAGSLRRALDGMLVILRLASLVPELDFLFLSAMIKEPDTFAGWISDLTGKECFPVDLLWKPSRQARGVIIYPEQEVIEAKSAANALQLQLDRNSGPSGGSEKGRKGCSKPHLMRFSVSSITGTLIVPKISASAG